MRVANVDIKLYPRRESMGWKSRYVKTITGCSLFTQNIRTELFGLRAIWSSQNLIVIKDFTTCIYPVRLLELHLF